MIVYRVENSDLNGPYYYADMFRSDWTDSEKHEDNPDRPSPFEDGMCHFANELKDYKYGFKSLDDLEKWFDGDDLDSLHSYGYSIVTIEVDFVNIIHGSKQIAFIDPR